LLKSNQICPNLNNFAKKIVLGDAVAASPAPLAPPKNKVKESFTFRIDAQITT